MSIDVLSPGLLTTVQDLGRFGWQHLGVGTAGALDAYAHTLANMLVDNPANAATLEITLTGPRLTLQQACTIALCGAQIDARCDGQTIPCARPVQLPAGSTLTLGACRTGTRTYLAAAGGIDVPECMHSRSTDLRGGFGGLAGRALRAGDHLPLRPSPLPDLTAPRIVPWWIDDALNAAHNAPIRLLPGADALASPDTLLATRWKISAQSNRQGLRLQGPALQLVNNDERISAPVAPGTVQLPPDGQPIVLLADAQTHGGYPCIGHVIRADRPRLAQLRPGDTFHFVAVTPQQAQQAWQAQQHMLARLQLAIHARREAMTC